MVEHLAIVGATGAVGREVCLLLAERRLDVGRVSLFASKRGAGTRINVSGRLVEVRELTDRSFEGMSHAVFSAGADRSRRFVPAAKAGTRV